MPYKNIDWLRGLLYPKLKGKQADFEWDSAKDELNQRKHGVSFALAQLASLIPTVSSLRTLNTVIKRKGIIVLAESLKVS